ncbi:MAG: flagellar motor switch protein FliM [Candidatus Manganitrophaceae bacterium]|nr:MAG: flagellar motor switch protein FliM [Candidatus Manganitrophaceae bacterium]
MSEKILSQDEITALLTGISGGEVQTEMAPSSSEAVRSFDISGQERIIRGRMPTLEIINDRFARSFQVSISALLRKPVEFTPKSISVRKFGEFVRKIPLPSSINLIKMDPLRGHALLVFDARMVYLFVDHFLGGSGQTHVKAEGRDFSIIEQRFTQIVVNAMLQELQKAWTPVYSVTLSLARSEMNPASAMIVVPTEVVVVVTFKLDIEGQGGEISLCLPYPTIEPIREKLYSGFLSDQLQVDNQWMERFKTELEGCCASVTVELGSAILSVREATDLNIGDIIVLQKGVDDDLTLKVEGRPKFQGKPRMTRGNLSFQITTAIQDDVDSK